ncbi:condensin complex subunit 2-like [Pollicipes pollicipes]|uniref:condensin complex subunit 2-like n=1 Tax=Pollicipes pollicipes TaxID=41117 RepID=UPI001884F716|nr:condensin complex subunit 2-like [Pollicipes pollicipes]
MAQMLRQKKSDLDNFQVASYTLDASAKIYGYRVEVLHGETLRMAGGLGRADNKQKTAEEGEPADGDQPEPGGADKRRRKARRHATVERNLANITARASGGDAAPSSRRPAAVRRLLQGFSSPAWSLADERDGQRSEEAGADLPPPPPAPPADLRHSVIMRTADDEFGGE